MSQSFVSGVARSRSCLNTRRSDAMRSLNSLAVPRRGGDRCDRRPLPGTPFLAAAMIAGASHGAVVVYSGSGGEAEWEGLNPGWGTIDFVGLESGELVSDQYHQSHGVNFLSDFFQVAADAWEIFSHDGHGAATLFSDLVMEFDQPIMALGLDHPGFIRVTPMSDGVPVSESLVVGGGGVDNFSGLVSDIAFDSLHLTGLSGSDFGLDDVRIGTLVPAPGCLAVAAFAWIGTSRRRERQLPGSWERVR